MSRHFFKFQYCLEIEQRIYYEVCILRTKPHCFKQILERYKQNSKDRGPRTIDKTCTSSTMINSQKRGILDIRFDWILFTSSMTMHTIEAKKLETEVHLLIQ